MKIENIKLTDLQHTWILDIDGTVVKHNGYKIDGFDTLLDGAKEFISAIPKEDMIIFLTAREEKYKNITIKFLEDNNIRYNHILFDVPKGERILINDKKPDGQEMAYSFNIKRDEMSVKLC